MPLRDHFRRTERGPWKWKSIHSTWLNTMILALNQGPLPPGFVAIPTIHLSSEVQVDVAAVLEDDRTETLPTANGAVSTAVWAPPRPPVVVACDWSELDVIEIQVYNQEAGYQVVAALELVSPANKDRPSHRQAFTAKCAAYLQNQVSLIIVDVVTERRSSLHAELMQVMGLSHDPATALAADLYAVAYRLAGNQGTGQLEMWPNALEVGRELPEMPLWIQSDQAIPLDLEGTYNTACRSLRMPQ